MTEYWRRWPVTVSWAEPCEVVGTLMGLGDPKEKFPQMHIRTPQGLVVTINVVQARLHELLAQAAPNVGDKIRVRYLGEASKAAPGLSPTKQFTVEVWPQKNPRPPVDGTGAATSSENAQEAGA